MYSCEQLNKAKAISFECNARNTAHTRSASYFSKCDKLVNAPQVILGAIVSTMSVSNASTSTTNNVISIFIAVCSTFTTIFASLNAFFSFSKKKSQHLKASTRYNNLHRKIEFEVIKTNKQEFDIFYESVINEYNECRHEAPLIPTNISVKKIIEEFKVNEDIFENKKCEV